MTLFDLVYFTILALYVLGTLFYMAGAFSHRVQLKRLAGFIAGAGLLLHTLILIHFLAATSISSLSVGYFIKLFSWCLVAIFFILWWRFKLEFLALIASPIAILLFIFSFTHKTAAKMPPHLAGPFFGLHIGTLFGSMALLAMAFAAGIIFLRLEKKIKGKARLSEMDREMPALSTFDRVNYWAVVVGFPLYTIGMLAGFVFAKLSWGQVLTGDPKEIVSIVVWLLFAVLFHNRLARGWWGRRPAVWAIGIFTLAIGSMIVINFFVPSHHSFRPIPSVEKPALTAPTNP
ncbi:inner membrane protein YpjD [Oceanidesulfovibrio marinus]|uniref:Cytochrome C assembly protein n=1 Tax=Oceanidesulfovibrio marinus TaxID=370038 RepID=A0A6P1ZJS7_9BACT|nr:cytochrome c biogenesis protein CcsA [Oceanidesulfovibrio marinus]QJT08175.1 cytochrome C assembly protein [Oceanidesulfovibrio marinus]TVM35070.1 cytochrome C assembly protein [Oceanidesulfovibrio marinus]